MITASHAGNNPLYDYYLDRFQLFCAVFGALSLNPFLLQTLFRVGPEIRMPAYVMLPQELAGDIRTPTSLG